MMNSELSKYVKDTRDFRLACLRRVKPYVQCGGIMWKGQVSSNGALGRLIWPAG
jgi:hypothetical protein